MHPKLNPLSKVNYTHTRHVPRRTAVPTAPQSPSAETQVSQPTPIALESYDSFIFPLDANFIKTKKHPKKTRYNKIQVMTA